ncbi:MAG: sigma-70 family RNA polymerase sigma factor [Proteobacteria bacterium]|nr:sigma-70 family RNA polymerase sigma factor [Pseudomonadota bacterium]MBS0494592.1 sigma-70 family RNA polymerase sigma factor [Pseudomonadota bacterium]
MIEANVAGAWPLSQFLRMAVMAGVESAVQIHIERGDDLNARDARGMTPLMLSAVRNKPAICQLLLSAGADHDLRDPSGRTALDIAIAARAEATAAILGAVGAPLHSFPQLETEVVLRPDPASEPAVPAHPIAEVVAPGEPAAASAPAEPDTAAEPLAQEAAPPLAPVLAELGDGEFDLSGWEVEEEPTRPEVDLVVVDSASAVQIAITAHEPIDSSAEWDDINIYLPEVALPLARADDAEGRAKLRLLLLRSLREGSVPALDVQAQSTNEDRSANPEAEAYLAMVINDLGAEADERFEYADADESFEVFIDPEESPVEEATLDEALVAIDRAASPRHEPLRIYQREFQSLRLLTAEEEVRLAKDMEAALDLALDALASWPDGIARTLAAGADAIAGSRQLSSIWVAGEPDPEPASAEGLEAIEPAAEDSEDFTEDDGEPRNAEPPDAGNAGFADALRRLAALTEAEDAPRTSTQEIRHALAGLRLNRRFLLELIDAAHGSAPCPAFACAMAGFRQHRDRMTAANLKLAFFHAKKYLYSGEPLDDLAQEGNIGLLKAVDRYDWHRGFRFSTYATWWIRQQISRYVADKARTIRVPVHIFEKLQRAERIAHAFEKAFDREPTLAELAERVEMPSHKLAALLRIAPEPSSIDEATVDSMIAIDARDDYASPDPAEVVDEMQLNQAVDRYISSLSTEDRKEERILRMRFGIGIDEALTLDEIGLRFDVTRERIRQIEAKAIRKLQHVSRSEPFARMVLGLDPEENPLAPRTRRPSEDNEPDTVESIPQPATLKRQAAPRPPREPSEMAGASKPSKLDQVLAKAVELGIPVNDERLNDGNIWVELLEPRNNTHRRLIRNLLDFGFAFWPGKGYWK